MILPKPQKIWLVQLTNERSGSPRILRTAALCLVNQGVEVHICTSFNPQGLLSGINGAHYHFINYRWSANKWVTLLRYSLCQVHCFLLFLWKVRRSDIVYCNTLLSAGASLAARVKGAKVLYHVHELCVSPSSLDRLLKKILWRTAHEVIFVSSYLQQHFDGKVKRSRLIENCLSNEFETAMAEGIVAPPAGVFVVALVCSLKQYKGIDEFAKLAVLLPDMQFNLTTSAGGRELEQYQQKYSDIKNLKAGAQQSEMINVYRNSHVVVSLSVPELIVETFGLTLLEAMACSRPVIAPAIGGPTGFIENGVEGFLLSVPDITGIANALRRLQQDAGLYQQMSEAAFAKAKKYSQHRFCTGLNAAVNDDRKNR